MHKLTFWLSTIALGMASTVVLAAESYDTDGDGYDDNSDNCTLTWNPDQRDTNGDFMGNACDGDFDGDFVSGFADLSILGNAFFSQPGGPDWNADTDINGDDVVNFGDLGRFKQMLFGAPGPTGADPDQPPCVCYFSGDCGLYGGGFCDYGPGSYTVESNCVWRAGPSEVGNQDAKPVWDGEGSPNNYFGCSRDDAAMVTGNWVPSICDGLCVSSTSGSVTGNENRALVAQAVGLWAEAMLSPSVLGGGPLDEELADEAKSVPFVHAGTSDGLGRHTADLLGLVSRVDFQDYFCHWEGHAGEPNPPTVDLLGDVCAINAAEIALAAFSAEVETPGSARVMVNDIKKHCPDWQTRFAPRCAAGEDALQCVGTYIEGLAQLLTTESTRENPSLVETILQQASR